MRRRILSAAAGVTPKLGDGSQLSLAVSTTRLGLARIYKKAKLEYLLSSTFR
jgi:hypothetical protein